MVNEMLILNIDQLSLTRVQRTEKILMNYYSHYNNQGIEITQGYGH